MSGRAATGGRRPGLLPRGRASLGLAVALLGAVPLAAILATAPDPASTGGAAGARPPPVASAPLGPGDVERTLGDIERRAARVGVHGADGAEGRALRAYQRLAFPALRRAYAESFGHDVDAAVRGDGARLLVLTAGPLREGRVREAVLERHGAALARLRFRAVLFRADAEDGAPVLERLAGGDDGAILVPVRAAEPAFPRAGDAPAQRRAGASS